MYGDGKFFYIQSNLNGLVLDIRDGDVCHGQEVFMWDHNGGDNQLWFEDQLNGCIRSYANENLVLHIEGDCLQVQEFSPHEYNQRWYLAGDSIRHSENTNWVLDIAACCEDAGAKVCAYDYHGGDNQHWTFNYLPPKRFYIVSEMNGRVLDVNKGHTDPGTKIITYDRNDEETDNQLWWEDRYGIIHSCLTDLVLDTNDDILRVDEYDPDIPGRQWQKSGNRILNRHDRSQCIDINKAKDKNGAKMIAWEYNGSSNQCWTFEYID